MNGTRAEPEGTRGPGRTLRGLLRYFLSLGSSGFGGPIALVGYMRRDLVDDRGWYSEGEFEQGLAIAQTMPGPLAAQLAMWLGYIRRGLLGALLVSLVFVGPAFLFVLAVAVAAPIHGLTQSPYFTVIVADCTVRQSFVTSA